MTDIPPLSPKTFNRANIALTWITYAINNQFNEVVNNNELRQITIDYLNTLIDLFEKPENNEKEKIKDS